MAVGNQAHRRPGAHDGVSLPHYEMGVRAIEVALDFPHAWGDRLKPS